MDHLTIIATLRKHIESLNTSHQSELAKLDKIILSLAKKAHGS